MSWVAKNSSPRPLRPTTPGVTGESMFRMVLKEATIFYYAVDLTFHSLLLLIERDFLLILVLVDRLCANGLPQCYEPPRQLNISCDRDQSAHSSIKYQVLVLVSGQDIQGAFGFGDHGNIHFLDTSNALPFKVSKAPKLNILDERQIHQYG